MKKPISFLLMLSMIASMFVTVSAVEVEEVEFEVPGVYVPEEETETSANAVTADMTGGYQPITLDVPFYCQRRSGDCGISSIAMVEAYKKGYGSNDITAYNAVYNYNSSSVFLASYGKLGYETIANDLSAIYTQLKHDNPVIVYRTGNQKDHYSVIYGYNGSTSSLEKKGFLVLNTWHNSNYSVVEPGTIGYTNLETWLSGATWTHTMIRTGNTIPLSDKNNGAGGFNQVWASNIGHTNAQINAKIPFQWITACGFYIGTSTSNMTKNVEHKIGNGLNASDIWFDLNEYYKTLSKDTCYYYKLYYVSNGTTYTSKTYSFYTGYATDSCEHKYDNSCDTTCNTCGYTRTVTHNYSTSWSKDANNHWHECSCGEKTEFSSHSWNNGEVTLQPTIEAEGEKTFACTVCSAVKTEKIDKLEAPEVPADAPQLIMSSVETLAGKEITLTLLIKNNPGIAGLVVSLKYDTNVLTLIKTEKGTLFSGFSSAVNIAWDESFDVTEDGVLATFTFAVAEDAEVGDYSIEVIIRDCFNEDFSDVELTSVSGNISVIDYIYGDANGNNKIDMKDVILLRQYVANFNYNTNTSLVGVGYGADANCDGEINMKDIILLRQYIVNYDYDTGNSSVVLGPSQEG